MWRHLIVVAAVAAAVAVTITTGAGDTPDAPSAGSATSSVTGAADPAALPDPAALRDEFNKLGAQRRWYHDVKDVYIDGGRTVLIEIAEHDHPAPTSPQFLEICAMALSAAESAKVDFTELTVSFRKAVMTRVTADQPACHPSG